MAEIRTSPSKGFLEPGSLKETTPNSYTGSTLHEDDPFFENFVQGEAAASATTTPETDEGLGPVPKPKPNRKFPRISLPIQLMRTSYDVVVIGTGYGGSVAASRMARGRQSVCVLERGLERWPGEFPEQLADAAKEIRISGEFAPGDRRSIPGKVVSGGNPTGLYHFMTGDGQNAFVGNGLGGGSLVNANVFLESTPEVLEMNVWPKELRGQEKWREYYDRAMSVLEPVEYPSSYPELAKANLLQRQAESLGLQDNFYRVKQTTRFHNGPNSTGVPMKASTLTGMDATGINDGSKSTTLVNYLSDAWNWGAEMFCECEVRHVAKADEQDGYIVYFSWHGSKRDRFEGFQEDLMWVHAKKLVFFGAGSLGTTEILLRSKQFGLPVSDDLGTEMSGNGDMLGFGYNTDYDANCIAQPVTDPQRPVGPCITSVLDMRKQENPLKGFVVEDCAVPYALAPLMYPMLEFLPDPNRPDYGAAEAAAKKAARMASRLFGAQNVKGSVAKTAVYLIMSHDSSQGSLTLQHDKPVLTYSGVGRSDSVSEIHEFLEKLTAAAGGNFIANPAWTALGAQQITVHAIGGARISADGTGKKGVVNHMGQVFTGQGSDTYSGLVVCDGSMVPAAVGVNPFATITALAERSVEMVAKSHGIVIDYKAKNGVLDMFGNPAHPLPRDKPMVALEAMLLNAESDVNKRTIGFSEVMSGFIHSGPDIGEYEAATKLAKSRCEAARVFLDVKSWRIADLLENSEHLAHLTGTFMCNALGGTFSITNGKFQLFIKSESEPEARNMVYDFDMESTGGRKLHFHGFKVLNSSVFLRPWRLWGQTTTLYVVITDTHGTVVGRGTLYVHLRDFLRQMQTIEIEGPSWWRRVGVAVGFGAFFARQAIRPLLSTLGYLQWPQAATGFQSQEPSRKLELTASDGVKTTMLMWERFDKQSEEVADITRPTILFIPGAAVDHTIFALPTIDNNAINFFRKAGYRTYCITHRVGRTPEARNGHTPYDARLDIHAALAKVREEEGKSGKQSKVYVVAHCAGSIALSCGLLDGTIPGDWIQGITASMVFMNPKFGKINHLLSAFPTNVYSKLVDPWWDCTSTQNDTFVQRIINQALRFYPVGSPREACQSVVCHRSSLAFGRLWTHANLNEETHANLEHFLGGTSMRSLGWLMKAGSQEHVTTNEPSSESLVTPENIQRLKGIPILFLSGTGNMVFTAENTDRSYTTLSRAHGRQWYQREVFQGKGHLDAWMGSNAYEDVYPRVLSHVEEVIELR